MREGHGSGGERKELILRVADAPRKYANMGIAILSRETMRELGVESGDVIEIEGKKTATAVVWPIAGGDPSVIRIDGNIRRNAGVAIDDRVKVRKTTAKEARRVVLQPTQPVRIAGGERYLARILRGRPLTKGQIIRIDMLGSPIAFEVVNTVPSGTVIPTLETEIVLREAREGAEIPRITYEDIGGLKKEIQLIREMIELPLRHPELFERLGIEPPKGVLLHGPPGTGKTLIAKAVANETAANFYSISGPEIMSKYYGESERQLREIFEEARKSAPSIIFIDEIDSIAPKREETHGEVERRVVAQLLALMDGLEARGQVVVIGATNRVNALDPALRRPGRFDREIEIGIPDRDGREEILQVHTRGMPLAPDVDLKEIADLTHGFVGADLAALCKEAAMHALRRILPEIDIEAEEIPSEVMEKLEVRREDFMEALKNIEPSALREVFVEVPDVKWDDIGDLDNVKRELQEIVEWPMKFPEIFGRLDTKPPKGILLFGPPGTGKTMLAKAVANESESNFISIKGPEIMSKWVGESLPYDEKVFVRENGKIKRIPIGEIVENEKDVEVISFDDEGKVEFTPISAHIPHLRTGAIKEIRTATGRKIRVTEDHSLFTFDGSEIRSVNVGTLKKGDYIVIPRRIPSLAEEHVEVDLLEALKDEDCVYVRGCRECVPPYFKPFEPYPEPYLEPFEPYFKVKARDFLNLMRISAIKYEKNRLMLSLAGGEDMLPAVLRVDEDLCMILGLWMAGGDYCADGVRIMTDSDEILRAAEDACRRLSLSVSVDKGCLTINSKLFRLFMEKALGMKAKDSERSVPEIIWSLGEREKAAFLRGYFSCEGYVRCNSRRCLVGCSVRSEELADDLMYLLLEFGIVASIRERGNYIIELMGAENLKRFSAIGFIDECRNRSIKSESERPNEESESDRIPLIGALRELVADVRGEFGEETISRDMLREILEEIDPDREKYYWCLVEGDICFDRVVSVRDVRYDHKYVYDISVEPTESFLAGFGGIFAHNSERAVREVFRKARQAAPCVVFLDEIDSIAPARGAGYDTHVTERVVSQLLTELDGIEELKDVVVIAATNRPDIVDPALLRPGRFDRLIYVKPPDKEARKKIFEVHLRGKPLAKDVSIDELATKTEGYVGADIAALVREAVMAAIREFFASFPPGTDREHMKEAAKNIMIGKKHFDEAFKKVKPSASPKTLAEFEEKSQNMLKHAYI